MISVGDNELSDIVKQIVNSSGGKVDISLFSYVVEQKDILIEKLRDEISSLKDQVESLSAGCLNDTFNNVLIDRVLENRKKISKGKQMD